jgi:uncharacterized protein involved in exopolysaccharide biosynthesis
MEHAVRRHNGLQLALDVLNRQKWLAVLTFGTVFATAISIIEFLPDIYQSSATVLIERQQIPETLVRSTSSSAVETRLQTLSEEILSRSRLEGLINRYDLYATLRQRVPLEEVVEQARRDIKLTVKRVEQTGPQRIATSFTISYAGVDPDKVAVVTNAIASLYVEESSQSRGRRAMETEEFLASQLNEVKRKLDEQEQRLRRAKEREANLALLAQLNTQIHQNHDTLTRVSERKAALARQLVEAERQAGRGRVLGPDGRPTGTLASLEQRIAELTQKLPELQTRFTEKYPDVVKMKLELATLEAQRAKAQGEAGSHQEVPVVDSPHMQELKRTISEAEAEIKALKSEGDSLRRSIANYRQYLETTRPSEQMSQTREREYDVTLATLELTLRGAQQSQTIEREFEATKERYNSLLKLQEEAWLGKNMEESQKGEQLRLIEPAVPSRRPATNRNRLLVTGFLLSLGLAAGMVVLVEQWDTSFHKVDELRAFTRVPVLVGISRIVTKADVRRRRRRFGLAVTSAVLGLLLIVGLSYLLVDGNEQLTQLLVSRGL